MNKKRRVTAKDLLHSRPIFAAKRRCVREMLRIIFGRFMCQRLRKMRPRDGRRHGPYAQVARALGYPVSARDVRFVWTGKTVGGRSGQPALERIVRAIESRL